MGNHACNKQSMCRVGKHQQHINVHCVKNFCTHMKCEVKHNGDMGMGHLCLIMGGTFMT